MKLKTTKKRIKEGYCKILGVGYCDLQHLLNYEKPFGYSTRVEGWACDYYDVNGVCISTGYSPLNSQNVTKDYDLIREYDQLASKENTRDGVTKLLNEFIEKVV